ncbi:glycosyltransferase [Candidatus Curtissbacteria bacterium]|nr:glycosyltransferase [Candidatus Curtissbacteria bacterium]
MRLVVNIPTYNEEENIEEAIKRVLVQAKNLKNIDLHVIVSDSHSPDKTGEIVKRIAKTNPKVHYLDVKEKGLGIGVIKGHRYAIDKLKADILAQMDGDLSHDPSSLPEMVGYIQEGYDLVSGSRLMKGGKNLLGWHRRLFSRGSALYCKLAWGTFGISEYTNSYRVFTKKLFEKINKIKEVPIVFVDRRGGYSKAKIVSYTLDVLKFGLIVRLKNSITFIKFLVVGTFSYFINAIALGLLYRGQIYSMKVLNQPLLHSWPTVDHAPKLLFLSLDRLFLASLISIELSIVFNFFAHENWTFKDRSHTFPAILRLLKFNTTSIASPIIQLFFIILFARYLNLNEQVGLAVGVVVGLFLNYVINIMWIWKVKPTKIS